MILCTRCHRREAADFPQDPELAVCWPCIDRERLLQGTTPSLPAHLPERTSPLWAVALAMLMWGLILGFLWALS